MYFVTGQEKALLQDKVIQSLPQCTQEKVAILVASEFEGIFKNGGIGTYYRTLSQKLAQDGWKIILILFNEEAIFEGDSHVPHISSIISANALNRLLSTTDLHESILAQFADWDWIGREGYWILFFLESLCQYFSEKTHLYIEFQDFWGIGYPTIEAKESGLLKSNTVIATTIHGPHDWIFDVNNRFTFDDVNSWKWFFDVSQRERLSFEKADLSIHLSNFLKTRVSGYGWSVEEAIHLPYCFPVIEQDYPKSHDPDVDALNSRIGDRIPVVFFGRLEERKGFLVFVDALKKLKQELLSKIYVIFLGKVVSLSQHDIKQYNSQTYLDRSFPGVLSYDIFPDLFSQQALNFVRNLHNPIVCLTSIEENFPNTGLEIGQLGVSLVASATGGFQETIGLVKRQECLRWFKPGNAYSLKSELEDAIASYPEQPLVANVNALVEVNSELLARRFALMTEAFANSQNYFSVGSDASLTIHCHLSQISSEHHNLFLNSLKRICDGQFKVILTYQFDENRYYEYLKSIYPELKFIQVSANLSLGDIVNTVVNQRPSRYFLNLPTVDCILLEGFAESFQKAVARSDADVITFPAILSQSQPMRVESPPNSLLEILTTENMAEIIAAFKTDFILQSPYQDSLKLQAHNLHQLCKAMAMGQDIVNYPYPLLTTHQSLTLDGEPIEFLQQINSIYKTFASVSPQSWQGRQLKQVLSGCEKLSHLSIYTQQVEAARQTDEGENAFLDRAIEQYQKVLQHHPDNTNVKQKLGRIFVKRGDCDRGFELYELKRVDRKPIELEPNEVPCFTIVRNERLRLPYLLDFYRSKGIRKFFVAENNSEDGTREFLAEQPDVYVWTTNRSYKEAHMGIDWNEILLKKYGNGHWCLNIDADEVLYYPGFESFDIPELCHRLEAHEKYALPVVLLDMYSEQPVRDSFYQQGDNFLNVCPYFDRTFYHYTEKNSGPCGNMTYFRGGLRQRIFNPNPQDLVFTVNKVPLFRYDKDVVIYAGHHWTNIAKKYIPQARGALLHFKYLHSFAEYVEREVQRDEHVGGAFEYKKYQTKLQEDWDLTLFNANESVKLNSSEDLLKHQVMQIGEIL